MRRVALLLLVVLAALPPRPATAEQVPVRAERDGKSRLITFAWRTPVAFEHSAKDGRVTVRFSSPIEASLQSVVGTLGDVLTDVRRSNDGRSVSFGLRRPAESYAYYSGTAVTLELVLTGAPAETAAAPKQAPAPAEDGVQQRTAVVEARRTIAEAQAAPAGAPAVAVRTGEHPEYTRVVFDFASPVTYTVRNDGGVVQIRFKTPAAVDLGALNGGAVAFIGGARTEVSGGETIVTMAIPRTATVRDFLSGPKVVLDVRDANASATPVALPAAAPAAPRPADQATAAAAPAGQEPQSQDQAQDQPRPAPAPPAVSTAAVTEGAPLTPPVGGDGRPRALTPPGSPPAAATPAPAPATAGAPPPAAAPTEAPSEELSQRAQAPVPTGPLGAAKVTAVPGQDQVSLRFDFDEPVAAASFRHGGAIWMVFDKPLIVDTAAVQVQGGEAIIELKQMPNTDATVLRMRTSRRFNPTVQRDGLAWIIDMREREMQPQTPLPVNVQPSSPVGARVFVPVAEPGRPIAITDPNVGDNFIVVPLIPLGHAVGRDYNYPQFNIQLAAHGLVINPLIDDLRVRSLRQGVEITASGVRLAISNVSDDAAAHAQLAASRPMVRALEDLSREYTPIEAFRVTRRNKEGEVASAPPRTRTAQRMALAKFFFANGYAPETLGVLEVAKAAVPLLESDPSFRVMRGGASFLLGRYPEALADLTNENVQGNDEARLWAAATTAMMGDRIGSARDLRFAGAIARDYPRELKMQLGILIAEVAAETGDGQGARLFIDALNLENPTPNEKAQLMFAEGRLKELDGDYDAAVLLWEQVMDSDHRPSRARARQALTEMLLKLQRITPREAIEQYEKLRFAWRGDRREFDNLRRLGGLYLDEGFYRKGLSTLKEAATNFRDLPEATEVTKQMSDTFNALFLEKMADEIDPVKAIAVYNEFKELTPAGARGDLMIRNLADKLVEVDLLDRASSLLASQVQFRLQGEEKARVGARLALIESFAREYQKALDVLTGTEEPNLPPALETQRRHLRARVLYGLGRVADALALIEKDESENAELIRTEIHWNEAQWHEAAKSLRLLVRMTKAEPGVPLSDKQAARIINYAVALTNSGGERVISQLKEDFGPAMAQTEFGEAFQLVTAPAEIGVVDPSIVAAKVKEAETFLAAYRSKLKEGQPLSSIN